MLEEKEYSCPKCKGPTVPGDGKMCGYLFCLLCGMAVNKDDAERHRLEVANGEET